MMNKKEYIEALDSAKMPDELKNRIASAAAEARPKKKKSAKYIALAASFAVVILVGGFAANFRMGSKKADDAAPAEQVEYAAAEDCEKQKYAQEGENENNMQVASQAFSHTERLIKSLDDYNDFAASNPGFFADEKYAGEEFYKEHDLIAVTCYLPESETPELESCEISADGGTVKITLKVSGEGSDGELTGHPIAIELERKLPDTVVYEIILAG